MEDQILPQPPAYEDGTSVTIVKESSPMLLEVSNEKPGHITIKTGEKFLEASRLISEKFPEAHDFCKERLAISIERRQARLLSWRQHDAGVGTCGGNTRSLTDIETGHSHKRLEPQKGPADVAESMSMRWKNKEDFPRPPKIEALQSHFVCQICSLSMPSEEAEENLWMWDLPHLLYCKALLSLC
jgi:hypothetical protein